MTGARKRPARRVRIRWVAVAYYLGSGAFFFWLLGSVVVHLFGVHRVEAMGPGGQPHKLSPMAVYRCWASTNRAFRSLVSDFGREISKMADAPRDLKRTWGGRYGWDLIPLAQFPESRLTRDELGPWRWRLVRIRRQCGLTDSETLKKSKVLTELSQVLPRLDSLRVSLTRRIRSFVDESEAIPQGGEASLIGDIRDALGRARRLLGRRFHGRLPTPPRGRP